MSTNKKLIAGCMHINHKNIYHAHRMFLRDLVIKDAIEKTLKPIRHMDTEDWLLILT